VAVARLTLEAWLERVPELVRECVERWDLRLGEPYPAGAAGYAARVELADGTRAVLKLSSPDRESEHEAAALELYAGEGAVRLLASDSDRQAMLLERCDPGTPVCEIGGQAAIDVIVGLLPGLWRPAGEPFRLLADEAAWWLEELPREWEGAGRPFERSLLDVGLDALRELSASQGERVLVNQDLHGENVLAAQRQPWLVIDPKPLLGEREFGLAPVVRSFELGDTRRDVLYRLDRLSSELGLDRERARGWTIGQTLAWAVGSAHLPQHVQTVRWLVEAAQ
jgi:streptomycin 6-kinase